MNRIHRMLLVVCLLFLASVIGAAEQKKELSIWVARDVVPGPKVKLALSSRNIPVLEIAAYKIPPTALLLARDQNPKRPQATGAPVRQWRVSLASPREQPMPGQHDMYRHRQVNMPPLPPGVYLLVARGEGAEAWAVVNITHLAVVVKRSPKQVLVWVCRTADGTPVTGARAALHQHTGAVLGRAVTDRDGIALLKVASGDRQTVIVTSGNEVAAVPTAVISGDGILTVHFQTDRPVYRPGQTVLFKAILRHTQGRGYIPVSSVQCTVQVRDPKDNVLLDMPISTNAMGTLAGQFEIPSEGMVGPYSIVIQHGKESRYGTFSVAEYRKPEYTVTVTPVRKHYLAGEDVVFEVKADYYFGAPVSQARVRYEIRRENSYYSDDDETADWYASDDGNLYPHDTYNTSPFIAEGTVYTDDVGKVRIPVKTAKDAPDSVYSLSCTVEDSSHRQVTAAGQVPVFAAALRLALSTDVCVAPLGGVVPLKLKAVDLDGKPTGAKVTLEVVKPVWNEKQGRYVMKKLQTTHATVPASGVANPRIPAAAEGDLIVRAEARDSTGRTARTSMSFWVAGPFSAIQRVGEQPTLGVRLDRRTYSPGDTVHAWITNIAPSRPVLVTVEGRNLWTYTVLHAGKKMRKWDLKTSLEMSPNTYIEVSQWIEREQPQHQRGKRLPHERVSDFASDSVLVPIPDLSRKLNVQIESERTAYRPGDTARHIIRTTDQQGRPVSAEVAVSVVDQAIYALRPDTTRDLYTMFWGTRGNQVITNRSAPEEVSGGAFQRVNEMAPIRQRFVDTAFWNAQVQTGPDGTATVSYEVPGNLTTWRITARAINEETQVGAEMSSILASRPVMLRLAVPRQLVQGDRLVLVGTIHNRTATSRDFTTAISAKGLRIEGETIQHVQVTAGGEGTARWTIIADTLPEDGVAEITGRTLATDAAPDEGVEVSDALRVPVRIVPAGIAHHILIGGTIGKEQTTSLVLPVDRIEPASMVKVTVRAGLNQVIDGLVQDVLRSGRYGSPSAADVLLAASINGDKVPARDIRESLALLSRTQKGTGAWGWWEDDPADAAITAHALIALARAKAAGIAVPPGLISRGIAGAVNLYRTTNLWEHRALLASALALNGAKESADFLAEVNRRATNLSPYAHLLLAQAYQATGHTDWARQALEKGLANAAVGPDSARVPVGEHPGWSASDIDATAQALTGLVLMGRKSELQVKLARSLADPEEDRWLCQNDAAAAARALADYVAKHPQSTRLGSVELSVNSTSVPMQSKDQVTQVIVPRALLKNGENTFVLHRNGDGEVFFSIDATVFEPTTTESTSGVRVLRRLEVRNAAGVWVETTSAVKPAEPVRVTVLVWPSTRLDAIRVVEPVPAGFEYVSSDSSGSGREEVRDGAVIHFIRATDNPVTFRYYLRAESNGKVTALPFYAEGLRRPAVGGHTELLKLKVE